MFEAANQILTDREAALEKIEKARQEYERLTTTRGVQPLPLLRQALEALDACVTDNEPKARSRLTKALRAYPALDEEEGILAMLRLFAERYPDAVPRARRLLRDRPRLAAALGG